MRKLTIVFLCCCAGQVHAQDLLRYEPFDYTPVGGAIEGQTNPDGETWLQAYTPGSPVTPPGNIKIGNGNLAVPTELGSIVGNSAQILFSNSSMANNINQSGKAIRLPLAETGITSGTVYYSMAFRADDVTLSTAANGGFLAGLNNSQGATTNNPTAGAARLQARRDQVDNTKFNLGIFNNRSAVAVSDSWATTQLTVGDTYFIVASYEIVAGEDNDVSRLWINPDPSNLGGGPEPAATATDLTFSSNDINIASFLLRQSPAPSVTLDELRIGTTWASVTSAAAPPGDDADFDDDNDVDGNDFLIWQRGLTDNEDGTNATGDANNDTNVDGLDLAIWESDFGTATASTNPVPEPGSLALGMLAAVTVLGRATGACRLRK